MKKVFDSWSGNMSWQFTFTRISSSFCWLILKFLSCLKQDELPKKSKSQALFKNQLGVLKSTRSIWTALMPKFGMCPLPVGMFSLFTSLPSSWKQPKIATKAGQAHPPSKPMMGLLDFSSWHATMRWRQLKKDGKCIACNINAYSSTLPHSFNKTSIIYVLLCACFNDRNIVFCSKFWNSHPKSYS